MMREPIIVKHGNPAAEQQIEIEISLGNYCNYACSYCPDELHNGTLAWIEKDHIKRFLDTVSEKYQGRPVLVQYTGGEPSVYPGFEEILIYGRELGFKTSIITNASRTIRFWEKFAPYMDKVHMTFHQEFADINHFTEVVKIVNPHARVHVNFTMIPELFDDIHDKAVELSVLDNTTIALKALRVGFQSELYPYTDEQLNVMRSFRHKGVIRKSDDLRGPMTIEYDDGTTVTKPASRIAVDGENRWEGWNCWIGIQEIVVKPNGDIYRGVCKVGGKLGNIRDSYTFPTKPVACNRAVCACVTDIMTRKENPIR